MQYKCISPTSHPGTKIIDHMHMYGPIWETVDLIFFISVPFSFRIFLCNAKRHISPRSIICYRQLFVLLCQHFPLGNLRGPKMEGCQWTYKGKNCSRDPKCHPSKPNSEWYTVYYMDIWGDVGAVLHGHMG
jgi:hypothetical protein